MQELFNTTVLLLAVVMLTWHTVWMAGHARAMPGETAAYAATVAVMLGLMRRARGSRVARPALHGAD